MNLSTTTDRSGTDFNGAGSEREQSNRAELGRLRRNTSAQKPRVTRAWLHFALLSVCLAGLPARAPGQTKPSREAPLANRYLFIVETSRYMKSRGEGTLSAIQDLLSSGMNGQLQSGDTLGLWTFNDELLRGEFPLQEWSPQQQQGVTGRVINFLRTQRCEKAGKLDKVVPALQQVVKRSRYLTIVLISSGEDNLHGTPFDEPINKLYKTWRSQQEKAHMPFVTVFRVQNGAIAEYRVGQAPWKADLPALPQELQLARAKAKAAPAAPAAQAAKPSPPMLPPLIVSGHKPQGTAALPVATAPAPVQPLPPPAQMATNSGSGPVPAHTAAPATPDSPTRTNAQVADPAAKQDGALLRPVAFASTETKNESPSKSVPPPPTATTAEAHAAGPSVATQLSRESEPTTPAAPPEPATVASETAKPEMEATKSAAPACLTSTAAAVSPEPGFFSSKLVWLEAAAGAGLLVALVWRLRSRGRPQESVSLITHSLEQHRQ